MTDSKPLPQPANHALKQFPIAFADGVAYTGQLGVAWAPGRLNLLGEHTDYNDGFALPMAIDRFVAFAGRRRSDNIVRLWSKTYQQYAQFSLHGLPASFAQQRAPLPRWAAYVLGVATELLRENIELSGFDAVIEGDVPVGGGMSSSAALEVAAAEAFAHFSDGHFSIGYNETTLWPMQAAKVCQLAEQIASGVQCGLLDQAASSLGCAGHLILLDFRGEVHRLIPFDAVDLSFVVIDTGVRRDLVDTAYNERRRECEEATRLLRELIVQREPDDAFAPYISALRDISYEQFIQYASQLPEPLQKRVQYVQKEDARVLLAGELLEEHEYGFQLVKAYAFDPALLNLPKYQAVGQLLWQSHAGLRDLYDVSSLELDVLVEIARTVPGVLGARMMGAGFGGCTINLVNNDAIDALREAVAGEYPQKTGRQAKVDVCKVSGGPDSAWA